MKVRKFIYWFFSTKNRFVAFIFIAYLVTILSFSLWYQYLLNQDLKNTDKNSPHFVINPDVSKAKIRQDSISYALIIREDSLISLNITQSIDSISRNIPVDFLKKVAVYKNGVWYLSSKIIQYFDTIRNVRNNEDLIKYFPIKRKIIYNDVRHFSCLYLLPDSIFVENKITVYKNDIMYSEINLHFNYKSMLLSTMSIRESNFTNASYMYSQNYEFVSKQINRHYGRLIEDQFSRINGNFALRAGSLAYLYKAQDDQATIRKNLLMAKSQLAALREPMWNYTDILYFTTISLFANNYSDIYPNDTITRQAILLEFILVWFLTIAGISLEPDQLWFVRAWKDKYKL